MSDEKSNGNQTQEPTHQMALVPATLLVRLNRNIAMLEAQLQTLKEDIAANFLVRPYTQSQLMAFQMELGTKNGKQASETNTEEERRAAAEDLAAYVPSEETPA